MCILKTFMVLKLQNFGKSLLDVADNLGRASSVVKENFSKIDQSKDSVGAVPLLKTLLEGVEMTEKQLAEVMHVFPYYYHLVHIIIFYYERWKLISSDF